MRKYNPDLSFSNDLGLVVNTSGYHYRVNLPTDCNLKRITFKTTSISQFALAACGQQYPDECNSPYANLDIHTATVDDLSFLDGKLNYCVQYGNILHLPPYSVVLVSMRTAAGTNCPFSSLLSDLCYGLQPHIYDLSESSNDGLFSIDVLSGNTAKIKSKLSSPVSIEVFDLTGRLIFNDTVSDSEYYVFPNRFSSGIYVIRATRLVDGKVSVVKGNLRIN